MGRARQESRRLLVDDDVCPARTQFQGTGEEAPGFRGDHGVPKGIRAFEEQLDEPIRQPWSLQPGRPAAVRLDALKARNAGG